MPEGPAELVDERCDAGCQVKRAAILGDVVLEFLLDVTHQLDDFLGAFRKPKRCRRGNQPFSPAHEKLGVQLFGQVMKLKAYGSWR